MTVTYRVSRFLPGCINKISIPTAAVLVISGIAGLVLLKWRNGAHSKPTGADLKKEEPSPIPVIHNHPVSQNDSNMNWEKIRDRMPTDVVVQVEEKTFPLHRKILVCASSYFNNPGILGNGECQIKFPEGFEDLEGCSWVDGKALAALSSLSSLEELNISFTPACRDIAKGCFLSGVKRVIMNIEYRLDLISDSVQEIIDQIFCIFPCMTSLSCYLPKR